MKKLALLIILVSLGSLFYSCEESGEDLPSCTITNPQDGEKVFRGDRIKITAEVGNDTYKKFFYIDDSLVYTSVNDCYWDPASYELGKHNIRVEALIKSGTKSSDEILIELVDHVPEAGFYANQLVVRSGTEIQFTDISSDTPTSWEWDFGEGETSNKQNPTHTYTNEGVYIVSLTAANNTGANKLTRENYITVSNTNIVSDIEGNVYNTVTIGTQVWMKENLRTTKLNDGTEIQMVSDHTEWINLSTPGYCWYQNEEYENKNYYGALYNGYTVETNKLCPEGWHVPSTTDWNNLFSYLGGIDIAGGKMKKAGIEYWEAPNTGATNESGFNGLPGGYRDTYQIDFDAIGRDCSLWSNGHSKEIVALLYYTESAGWFYGDYENFGYSVRCIKD